MFAEVAGLQPPTIDRVITIYMAVKARGRAARPTDEGGVCLEAQGVSPLLRS